MRVWLVLGIRGVRGRLGLRRGSVSAVLCVSRLSFLGYRKGAPVGAPFVLVRACYFPSAARISANVRGLRSVQACGSGRELVTVHSWPHETHMNANVAQTPCAFVVKALIGSPGIRCVGGWC